METPEDEKDEKRVTMMPKPRLNDYSPNTMMIMGAALSGGDPVKMAKMLCQAQDAAEDQNEDESQA